MYENNFLALHWRSFFLSIRVSLLCVSLHKCAYCSSRSDDSNVCGNISRSINRKWLSTRTKYKVTSAAIQTSPEGGSSDRRQTWQWWWRDGVAWTADEVHMQPPRVSVSTLNVKPMSWHIRQWSCLLVKPPAHAATTPSEKYGHRQGSNVECIDEA